MKTKANKITEGSTRKLSSILGVICIFLGLSELAQAQDQYRDGSNTQPNNMVDGGSGTWDLTTTNWTTATGNANATWSRGGANAFFQAVPGTVTVADGPIFNSLQFEVNGYRIVAATGGVLLLPNSSAATITTNADVTAIISAPLETFSPIPRLAIASPGGFTKEGAGTLVLSGANTYFGSTAINAGTLSISSDANLGTAPIRTVVPDQLTFDNGATLQATADFTLNTNRGITLLAGGGTIEVTGANTLSYAGSISGTGNLGNLTKVGTGTLILGGRNSYMGTTFVNDGTLTLVNPGVPHQVIIGPLIIGDDVGVPNTATVISTGGDPVPRIGESVPVTVNSDGLFEVDFGDPVKGIGEGIGQLVINRGNVRVEGSLLPGFQDPVGQHLEMNGGSISGAGTIVLPDVTATSDASGNAATISANAKLPNTSRVLTVNDGPGSTDLLISGVIFQGLVPVGFTKEGAGTLVLSGANTYTGRTTINAGSLIVEFGGSIASAQTFVNAGGLLGGRGTIGGSVVNGGNVSPGNAVVGTLTVKQNYTQTGAGTLSIRIGGTGTGQHDLLSIGGTANLGGTLQLLRSGNFNLQVGDKIPFLFANGVSGTFSTILNPFVSNSLVKAEINILTNAVELEGVQGSITEGACNPNTLAVAKALDSAMGDPRMAEVIRFLDSVPLSEICGDLELIAPEDLASMFNLGVSLANIQTDNLERRMDDIRAGSSGFSARGFSINTGGHDLSPGLAGPSGPEGKSGSSVMQPTPENRWGVFVTGIGEFTDVNSTDNASGYYLSTGGVTFGVDYRLSPNFAIGLTGGYAHTNADFVNNGSLDVNGGTIGAYATAFGGGFYANTAAFGVFNGYDSHRTALLGTASGNTDGQDFNALVEAGYDWKRGGLTIGPLASFQYTYVGFDSFTEHGSLAPLSFSNQNAESTRTALGAKASYDWHVGHVVVKPELRAAWQHEFGDTDYAIAARFANGAGNSFTVNGPAIGRDSLLLGAGVAVLFNDRVSMYAYYDGELARTNYSSNNVTAGLRFTF